MFKQISSSFNRHKLIGKTQLLHELKISKYISSWACLLAEVELQEPANILKGQKEV